jgi:hypothetical protein
VAGTFLEYAIASAGHSNERLINMNTAKYSRLKILGYLWLVVLIAAFSAACQGKKAEPSPGTSAGELFTIDEIKSVLGTAKADVSGVVDVTNGEGEVIVTYRYFDVDRDNYETDFASEMAPKIQLLYKRYKALDRIHLQITANDPLNADVWKSFAEFTVDRKTVEEIHWTGFLARYLLDKVLKSKKS